MIGAFAAQIAERKRREREAARRRAEAARRFGMMKRAQHMAKRGWTKTKLSYRQIGKAYQRSLNAFKEKITTSGVSAREAAKQRKAALQNGKIPSAAAVISNYKAQAARIRAAANEIEDEKKIGYQDAPLPKKDSYVVPDMSWKRDDMRAADTAAAAKKAAETKRVSWWDQARKNLGDSLRSIADPTRNPRTAAAHKQIWDGVHAWQGIFAMRKDAMQHTKKAISEKRWKDAGRGISTLFKQSATVTRYTALSAGISTWNIITTPIRIFTHDIPEFYRAGKERIEGKDRFWDVLYTSTNLAGDVAGTYAMAKPLGWVDKANAGLLERFYGSDPAPTVAVEWSPGMPGRPSIVKEAVDISADVIQSPWYRKIWGHPKSRFSPANSVEMTHRLFDGDIIRLNTFKTTLYENIPENTSVVIRGSAVNNYKWVTGRPFDGGTVLSDMDLILVGDDVMKLWTARGSKYFGHQTEFASTEVPFAETTAPALYDLMLELERQSGRGVNFLGMTEKFYNFRKLVQGWPSIPLISK